VIHDEDNDVTRLQTPATRVSATTTWGTSSGSIDHGRFEPGLILDNRYRILGLLGRGGMGEVYRADDLRLGQQVALKFLPAALTTDPVRLAQFHNEVRTARQVSHPNVCRVYDIGEIDGQLFITMEYVDGEDLSQLLRRIGRLPEDKGIDVARQICAGLAAAHERGVLHRDLKPANIMVDGAGRARIMDFSLAAVGEVSDVRAGTPAYMAPEQLAGQEVTIKSDIYALGLVLYEIFTGRRVFDAKNLNELLEQHRAGTLTAPTTVVKALDPAIESAILRCLDPIPGRRPPSAIAVSAALPGGDPLAAALAAGETPSPEMVAAAGGEGAALSTAAAVAWSALAAIAIVASVVLIARHSLFARVPLDKPAAVLADRAEEIRRAAGYTDVPVDRASSFTIDDGYLNWAKAHGRGGDGWRELTAGRPAVVAFWYRTSRFPIVPLSQINPITSTDPPMQTAGMVRVVVDTQARLLALEAVPPQVEGPAGTAPPVDWSRLFAAAGLDQSTFTEQAPSRTPASYADERKAWKGLLTGTDVPVTVEAAAYRGKPVQFTIVMPWTRALRDVSPGAGGNNNWIFITILLAGAAWTSYLNLRRGRADRRGGFRIAAFMVLVLMGAYLLLPHVSGGGDEQQRFFARTGIALFVGAAMYLIYLGLEPFVRRLWPSMLVGWTRALAGRFRDPVVGRDCVVGVACGATIALLHLAFYAAGPYAGRGTALPLFADVSSLLGWRGILLNVLQSINNGMQNALISVFTYSAWRAVFEWITRTPIGASRWTLASKLRLSSAASDWIFVALAVAVAAANGLDQNAPNIERVLDAAENGLSTLVILIVLLRLGILAFAIAEFASSLLQRTPMTFDSNALYVSATWVALVVLAAIVVFGFRHATEPARV